MAGRISFTASSYDCLQSRYIAHTDNQKREKELRAKEAKTRLLTYSPVGKMLFHHWWCSNMNGLYMPDGRWYPANGLVQLMKGKLSLLCSEIVVYTVHELVRFVFQLRSESGTNVTLIDGRTVLIAQLDG